LDGHESHNSLEFKELCKENNIITLCMPPHASHLLQPLDVGCFAPLKKAYGRQIEDLARNHINHITKLEFLPAFKAALDNSFTKSNICASFQGAGLVPLDPEAVLSKLDVMLRTPSPAAVEAQWESRKLSNSLELGSQSALIRNCIQMHQTTLLLRFLSRLIHLLEALRRRCIWLLYCAIRLQAFKRRMRRLQSVESAKESEFRGKES
jgi:hypothetical protein